MNIRGRKKIIGKYLRDANIDGTFNICETRHCLAGWAVHLAGEAGRKLEADRQTPPYTSDERVLQ
jgi:hypothetical protein